MPFRGCPRFSGTTKHQCRVVNSRHLKGDGNGWSSVSANHFAIVHNDIRSCILQTGGNKATGVIWACCTIRWFPPPHTYLGKAEHLQHICVLSHIHCHISTVQMEMGEEICSSQSLTMQVLWSLLLVVGSIINGNWSQCNRYCSSQNASTWHHMHRPQGFENNPNSGETNDLHFWLWGISHQFSQF